MHDAVVFVVCNIQSQQSEIEDTTKAEQRREIFSPQRRKGGGGGKWK